MQIQNAVNKVFVQLIDCINQLTQEQYVQTCRTLHNNTIGQHVRHIVEFYQCLELGYGSGVVDYEKRERNRAIENDKVLATAILLHIVSGLDKENLPLQLSATYDCYEDENPIMLSTNYYREIAYNLEHTIHHMALIRIGIKEISAIDLSDDFGVASSTIKYRKQCAQ
jgi:hypothetical protein